jgi:GntR family transcriptional repressor for pyruvate dehydrogenase complex
VSTQPRRAAGLEPPADGAAERPRLYPVKRDAGSVAVRRVRKAYEQVADQLRELIMNGELSAGERLPNEALLAREFGVSRATIREALRVLAAQNLLRTAKGAGGGSYVTLPSVDHISEFVRSNINLLTDARDVTLEELIEARELLEVPAARLAAERREGEDLERLRTAIPDESVRLSVRQEFAKNRDFHSAIIDCCGNSLLYIAAQPVFSTLQTHLARSGLGRGFHRAIRDQHVTIVDAIASADPEGAADEMRRHLAFLVPYYEKAWRDLGRRSS